MQSMSTTITPQNQEVGLWPMLECASHAYFRSLKVRKRSERHLERIQLSLSRFELWVERADPRTLGPDEFDEYALWLMEKYPPNAGTPQERAPGTLSEASQRAYLIDLRGFIKWGSGRGIFPEHAYKWVPVPPPSKSKPKRAFNDDIARIIEAAKHNLRDFTICCLLIDFGPRAGELASMRIEECDLNRRVVKVDGKMGERHAMLSGMAADSLRTWISALGRTYGYVFPSPRNAHLTAAGIHSVLRRLKEKAGVKGRVNPHAWRHAYITNSLVKGGNLGMTRVQAGHTSIATTQMYMEDFMGDELRAYQDRVTSLPDVMPDVLPSLTVTPGIRPRPTREELLTEIQKNPNWQALGRMYGVSGVAVKKWGVKWELLPAYEEAKRS